MTETNRLIEIRNDILREMYAEAEPSLDFDDVLENPDKYDTDWYSQHYLDGDRSEEILHKHLDKHTLHEQEESSLMFTCILDLGPSNVPPEEESDE